MKKMPADDAKQLAAQYMAGNKKTDEEIELEGLAKAKEAIEKRLASINVAEDIFNSGLSYTGDATNYMLTLKGVDNTEGSMHVEMISGVQVSTSASVGLDDIIRSQKTLTAAY